MTPKLLTQSPPDVADSALRLSLNPAMKRQGTVDGAWWPHSRDAAAELPALISAVDERFDKTTLRVGVHRDAWNDLPRRVPAPGRQVKVGWFLSTDPLLITLILSGVEPVTLLVIPPETGEGPAEAALTLAAQDTDGMWPSELLTIAHLPAQNAPSDTRSAPDTRPDSDTQLDEEEGPAGWENEGGHLTAVRLAAAPVART
ncbi:DUF5994 family protein [Nonomuraea recticatena]|uniref:DUF5994 family protein n=1 Tax=Nonomuraea recticatena TaxID=46178 RepID=A0ABN3SAV3_9ACTN